MTEIRVVHTDCRHYRGDRPCQPHKVHSVFCPDCRYYDPIETRILVVKLGAAGDVLRTTSILGSIAEMYPKPHITWISGRPSYALIKNNPNIDRPLTVGDEALLILDRERFDLCVNFDLDPAAVAIDRRVNADVHKGFGCDERGAVIAYDRAGGIWLNMSLWDDAKKANAATYQSHMRNILGAPDTNHPIQVPLLPDAVKKARDFAEANHLKDGRPVIGFNVGAGERWQHKKWTVEGFSKLAASIHDKLDAHLVVLYGPADRNRALEVMAAMDVPFIDSGLRESMMEFFGIVNLCDLVVTGDTFALHAALGLQKRVVCLVGPTSASELELYGQGVVLQGDIDCLGCYLTCCDKDPHCMKLLPESRVFDTVQSLLKKT